MALMSACGTERTPELRSEMSAFRGKADIAQTCPLMTRLSHRRPLKAQVERFPRASRCHGGVSIRSIYADYGTSDGKLLLRPSTGE